MRKFKFVGTEEERIDYSFDELKCPMIGEIYYQNHVFDEGIFTVLNWAEDGTYGHEWKEVFDNDTTVTNHKDTDLGYFAGLLLSSGKYIPKDCIDLAKELIKQLNEEKK